MITYKIRETLQECAYQDCVTDSQPYVSIVNSSEWEQIKEQFQSEIDMDFPLNSINSTKIEVNYDALTGTFNYPDRTKLTEITYSFSFVINQQQIMFIDDTNCVNHFIQQIAKTRKWKLPSIERFLYDFLELTIKDDLVLLETIDNELSLLEETLLEEKECDLSKLSHYRHQLRILSTHYEQLVDLSQELYENENEFFNEDNLRYFHLFTSRVNRLENFINNLKDMMTQIRDLNKSNVDKRQNKIMSVLTIVTSIFLPLTLLAGWYGMNFKYMPELNSVWGYPVVILVSVAIVIGCWWYFRHKKWL